MPRSKDGCPTSLLVLPWTNGEPDYHDKYRDGPQWFTGFGLLFYSVRLYVNAPKIMVPGKLFVSLFTLPLLGTDADLHVQKPARLGLYPLVPESKNSYLLVSVSCLLPGPTSCWLGWLTV